MDNFDSARGGKETRRVVQNRGTYRAVQNKNAPTHSEASEQTTHQKTYQEPSNSGDSVKYMTAIDKWFDDLLRQRDGEAQED